MLIIAIYTGHDPAVCVLRDGEVVLNIEKERLTRVRYERFLTRSDVEDMLRLAGVSLADADVLALPFPANGLTLTERAEGGRTTQHDGAMTSQEQLDGKPKVVVRVHHHLAHAALAFFASPFREAAILTWDAGGDHANTSFGIGRDTRIEPWQPILGANVGEAYMRVGFNNFAMRPSSPHDTGSPAGKLMALAAYGAADSTIKRQLETEIALFTGLRMPQGVPGRTFNNGEDLSDTHTPRARAVAASLQELTEEYLGHLIGECERIAPEVDALCLAGGVTLNCIANTRVFQQSRFNHLYVPPSPGDGGLALGQALYVHHQLLHGARRDQAISPYNGPDYGRDRIAQAIRDADLDQGEFEVREANAEDVATLIADGEVLALFIGRSETGPRALGHRSLVARPDKPTLREHLNARVKQREYYRPFAPIVLAEHIDALFEPGFPPSPYMSTTAVIRPDWAVRLAAVSHVDRTTRPQVLTHADDPWLYDMVSRVHRKTGVPAIVNTSFNRQEPIVETPENAIATFKQLPIRGLYLDGVLLQRRGSIQG